MSWSFSKIVGAPDKVRAKVEAELDRQAKCYEGKAEQQDVLSAKAAILSWLDEVATEPKAAVMVEASGSRGQTWLDIKVTCSKIPFYD